MLRRRNVNLKTVKELDAFPKIPETYKNKSAVGGTFSFITFVIISWLVISETRYFLNARLHFKFEPDTDVDDKLKINIDMTVAMPCSLIGADILDSTNQNLLGFEPLTEEETWWELSPNQRSHFDALKHMNSYLREEYHAIHELLWRSNQVAFMGEMPKRTVTPDRRPDACRLYGNINLNKVAGNFHITAGKSLSLPRGHIHIFAFMTSNDYNFTHRINKFSFGEESPGIVQPLDGDEKIADDNMMLYQYFIEIVPTDIHTLMKTTKTYQYSVKDYQRPINHARGSHGVPGIFFKYDTSALKVKVTRNRDSFIQFLVKLCATVGGIYVTSGLINSVIQACWYIVSCKFFRKEIEQDRRALIDKKTIGNKITAPLNLINVATPDIIDVTLNPQ
ncbi:endoplasmic reticulum-Golgi intermediate compartment protein 2 [Microplitis demolitor]|uniref:endoplasmic reticulum-Golgi intermediate compartment protein 2 n=1 Tax=Microplitis demolitor TaxID=69319 RepID=UPI0006D52092|nr:endoplasmic reticulum-Golgi intermediate compartment protein 2 [Microplitis demolitor]